MSKRRFFMAILIMASAVAGFFVMYSAKWGNETTAAVKSKYICPMHPSYISDRPGDCPICNMRLVPANAPAAVSSPPANPVVAQYTCPMHPKYMADKPGNCPICDMELVPAKEKRTSPPPTAGKYVCPMHPKVVSDQPGRCPECGMDLQSSSQIAGMTTITVDDRGRELAGVQTTKAVSERMQHTIRTVGMILADETRVKHIHVKVSGWIEKLFVNFSGQMVKKGEPLLTIYSPELMTNQREFLEARESLLKGSTEPTLKAQREELFQSARRRLELLDVPESFIAGLEKSGKVERTVTMIAPATGFVTTKQVFEGQQIEPGNELFTVTDIGQVWVEADFYEFESQLLKIGQEATFTSPYNPELQLSAPVVYIYPYLNAVSRTLKVRFRFDNPDFYLKLGMYLDVSLKIATEETVVIPDSAILDSGIRQVVFVALDSGRFEPRNVRVGIRSGGKAQILSGVHPGEMVVVKGNFLLDSESRLRSAISEH